MNEYSNFILFCLNGTKEIGYAFAKAYKANASLKVANESKNYYTLANESFKDTLKNIWKKLVSFFKMIFEKIRDAIMTIFEFIIRILSKISKGIEGIDACFISYVDMPKELRNFIDNDEILNKQYSAKWREHILSFRDFIVDHFLLNNEVNSKELKELKSPKEFYEEKVIKFDALLHIIHNTNIEFSPVWKLYMSDPSSISNMYKEKRAFKRKIEDLYDERQKGFTIDRISMVHLIKRYKEDTEYTLKAIEEYVNHKTSEESKESPNENNNNTLDALHMFINVQKDFIIFIYHYVLALGSILIRYSHLTEKYFKTYKASKNKISLMNERKINKEFESIKLKIQKCFENDKKDLLDFIKDKADSINEKITNLKRRYDDLNL